jgi:DNA adenine methylase
MISEANFSRYFEPFCGGAALFFQLAPRRGVLSDTNAELINCYKQVKHDPELVIAALRKLKNSEDHYYVVRDMNPRLNNKRAARVIYLTTLAFNGIYRVNQRGEFNVPYGYKTHVEPCDEERIRMASRLLRRVKLLVADFETAVAGTCRDDLIYFDPPYTVAHGSNGFVKYNEKILQWEDQIRLAQVAGAAVAKGCKVIVSNADQRSIRKLYRDFEMERVGRASIMAASASHRRCITECVFHNLS